MVSTQAGSKLFHKNIPGYTPPDPVYDTYIDEDGEEKKRKREIPAGLSERDIQILQNVKRSAHKLDKEFSICGLAFGWGFVITLIPGFGDVLCFFLNYSLILVQAQKAELPKWLEEEMLYNQAIAFAWGMIPILGAVVVAIFGWNGKNVALLEEYLTIRGSESLKPEGDRLYDPKDIKPDAGRIPNPGGPDQRPLNERRDGEV